MTLLSPIGSVNMKEFSHQHGGAGSKSHVPGQLSWLTNLKRCGIVEALQAHGPRLQFGPGAFYSGESIW